MRHLSQNKKEQQYRREDVAEEVDKLDLELDCSSLYGKNYHFNTYDKIQDFT